MTIGWQPRFLEHTRRIAVEGADDAGRVEHTTLVDVSAEPHAPLPTHPALMQVTTPTTARTLEADPELHALADRMIAVLFKLVRASFVGVEFDGTVARFAFYVTRDTARGLDLAQALAASDDVALHVSFRDDAGWSFYREWLLPDPIARQQLANREMLARLTREGDDLTQPRTVEHFAYFRLAREAEHAREMLLRRGFTIAPPRELPQVGSPRSHPIGLVFARVDRVDAANIDAVTTEVQAALVAFGGDYDGWGCSIVEAPSA